MIWNGKEAPGCSLRGCPGAVLLVVLALALPSCDQPGAARERRVLELEEDTIRLEPGTAVVDVLLRSDRENPLEPDTVRIRPGDVVRYVAADARPHAVAFDHGRLAPEAAAFLQRTGQLRGPPLIHPGASWVVSFRGAPPGVYPFIDLSQSAQGVIIVAAPPGEATE